jgi:hypothetical chaperone protein
MTARAVGIDFGTTNSAVAVMGPDGALQQATFKLGTETLRTFRSLLYFEPPEEGAPRTPAVAGPEAIELYLEEADGRLIQSLKSFLASESFRATSIFGRNYTFEDLLALLLGALRRRAEATLGPLGDTAVVGRPVHFAGAHGEDRLEDFAEGRLRRAFARVGFTNVQFEAEPVAAAYTYEASLGGERPLALVADFGGGTSDFCLMRVGQGAPEILGTDGAAVAGDVLDSRIVRKVVAPALGAGSKYRMDQKALAVPAWIYGQMERWHHLSFLKARKTMHLLIDIARLSLEPEKIEALLYLVRADLGFHLYQAVERAKVALSDAERTRFVFECGPIHIEQDIERAQFETWIAQDVAVMGSAVDRLLEKTGVSAGAVDRVYFTGGTSSVPAVKALFEARFGAERLVQGDRFSSVARGLARRAA